MELLDNARSPIALLQAVEEELGRTNIELRRLQDSEELVDSVDAIPTLQEYLKSLRNAIDESLPLMKEETIKTKPKIVEEPIVNSPLVEKLKSSPVEDILEIDNDANELLGKVRTLLSQEYHASVQIGVPSKSSSCSHSTPSFCRGCNDPLVFPNCRITLVTENFINLLQETLSDAFNHDEKEYIEKKIELARMMIELWRCVIPVLHSKVIKQVPRVAALFRNDALYIAYHAKIFPLHYPIHKLSIITSKESLTSLVEPLESLAEEEFEQNSSYQIEQILDTLKRAGGLQNTHLEDHRELVDAIFAQVTHSVSQLSSSWNEVLPDEILHKTLGNVINAVFDYLITEVMQLDDFCEEETFALNSIFCGVYQDIEAKVHGISNFVPLWKKFKILASLFNMSMVGIIEMWENKELEQFTAEEIRKIIIALFSNSAFREKNLAKIK